MNVGVFLALQPYCTVEDNLKLAKAAGFDTADITDTHAGGSMFGSADLAATVSLDGNPFDTKRLFDKYGIKISTICAHAALLDPSSPARFATDEIMKAVKFAAAIGIRDIITTEFDAHTEWAKKLTFDQAVFTIAEKLYEPCRMASDYGVKICLEPHGPYTDTVEGLKGIMDTLDNIDSIGVNLDTGNSWLGGSDPVELAKVFKDRIYHIHWKDLGEEFAAKRGKEFGCGFSTIELGTGVINIKGVIEVLRDSQLIHNSTLEIAGTPELLRASADFVKKHWNVT